MKHHCDGYFRELELENTNGNAFVSCIENDDGNFVVTNSEYSNVVQYCPYCGKRSKIFEPVLVTKYLEEE